MDRTILSLREVATYLRVHASTVYRLLKRKQLPAFKVGRDWRFDLESIDAWRKAQEIPCMPPPRQEVTTNDEQRQHG